MHLLRSSRIVSAGKTSLLPNAKISDFLTVTSKISIDKKNPLEVETKTVHQSITNELVSDDKVKVENQRLKSTHFQNPFAFRRI